MPRKRTIRDWDQIPLSENEQVFLEYVRANPGSRQTEIIATTGISQGSIDYIFKRLNKRGLVRSEIAAGRRYYPADSGGVMRELTEARLGSERSRRCLEFVQDNSGCDLWDIVNGINESPTVIRDLLADLRASGKIIVRNMDGMFRIYLREHS